MRQTHRRWLTAAVASTGAGALAFGAVTLPAGADENDVSIQPDKTIEATLATVVEPGSSGPEALDQLTDAGLAAVASRAGMTAQELKDLLAADLAIVSSTGHVAIVDQWKNVPDVVDTDFTPGSVPGSPEEGSRPGAKHTIYIDFGPTTIEGTLWNSEFGVDAFQVSEYQVSDAVKAEVWERIAQDYAPFDVNVTLTDPGADLWRSGPDDDEYGSHLLIVGDNNDMAELGLQGGVAWLNGFGSEFFSPALVSAEGVNHNPKAIADAGSHEVGHNLGLNHHGHVDSDLTDGDTTYYVPSEGLWGPIMGAPYNVPIGTWSTGDYAGADNDQDDIAVMTDQSAPVEWFAGLFDQNGDPWEGGVCRYIDGDLDNDFETTPPGSGQNFYEPTEANQCAFEESDHPGAPLTAEFEFVGRTALISDPHGDSTGDATSLDNADGTFADEGVIIDRDDTDVFSVVTIGGPFVAIAEPASEVGATLDIKLSLLDSDGEVIEEAEEETTDVNGELAAGMGASITTDLDAGVYYLAVEGRGEGDPSQSTVDVSAGYTDYGSLGYYTLTGAAEPLDVDPVVITAPEDGAEVDLGELDVTGTAEPGAEVSLTLNDDAAADATADDEGNWSTSVDVNYGESTITATQSVEGLDVPGSDSVTVSVAVPAPEIAQPSDGDTARIATPTFSGTGIPGATVTLMIVCEDDFSLTADADDAVDADGEWSFTPEESLPNGDCTVVATQTINNVSSPSTDEVNFTVDVRDDEGDEDGDEDGTEDGDEDGTEDGDEDGDDLPDTGAGNLTGLAIGALLLVVGGALFARTRRAQALS
ncbi:Ig-like domain-containing protein [Phytoactinopolyspora limicola]|uniref:Ig-like domain-containing protein n=1 Tax=Phytoactinopolyspora limicola TaxID=2715536 RepID=UPI001A9C49A3|nr:Ig-like domain-containing protein [Phytoactinopolyspora limicola]